MYNHPSVLDDYQLLTEIRDGFDFIAERFKLGYRYFSAVYPVFFYSFSENPTLQEMQHMLFRYKLFSLFIILFFISTVFYVLKQLNSYVFKLSKQYFVLLYALILFILVNSVQMLSTFFYSMISSAGYTLGMCFLFVFIGVLFKYHFSHKKKVFYSIVLMLSAFIINGCVEFYPILLGLILFIYLCYSFYTTKKIDFFIAFLLLFCFFIALTFISPPWLKMKRNVYAKNVINVHTVQRYSIWLKDMASYFLNNLLSYFNFKLLPIMVGISCLILTKIKRKIYIEGALVIYIISIIISYTLFYTGIAQPTKHVAFCPVLNILLAINAIFIFTSFLQFFQIQFLRSQYKNKIENKILENIIISRRRKVHFFIFMIFYLLNIGIFGIFTSGLPVRTAWKDILKESAQEYDTKLKKRYAEMTDYSIKSIKIEEITTPPSFFIDAIWSYQKFCDFPNDVNLRIGTFFNKEITVLPLNEGIE